jgi:hypothetical protein
MREIELTSLIRLIQRDHPSLEQLDRVSLLKTLRAFQDLMKTQSEIRKYVLKQLGPPFANACHDALAAGRELRLRHVDVIEEFWTNGEALRPVVEQCVFHASRKAYLGFLDLEMKVTEHLLREYMRVFDIETFEAARELGS